MTVTGGVQAWITSAVEDQAAKKAIVLAGSLRSVYTSKKLAVLTTLAVSKELREKLKEAFDLVVLLEQDTPNGLKLEDHAKVQGFSLLIFNKCVYVSPNAIVLRNCDEIFEKYESFAAFGNAEEIDSSVYVFVPSLVYGRALDKVVQYVNSVGEKASGDFTKYFNVWMRNHIPNSSTFDERYNLKINLANKDRKSLNVDVTIARFVDFHPLDIDETTLSKTLKEAGPVETIAVERCLKIYSEIVKPRLNNDLLRFTSNRYGNEPIAIVGLSFRLPAGNNVNDFWESLRNGKEGIKPVPSFRWQKKHLHKKCENRNIEAGFLDIPLDEFDAKFFGISPVDAEFIDPQQRLLHEVAWEAFEDAMIDPHTLRGSNTGIFCGSWIHDYKDIAVNSEDVEFFRTYMGNSIAAEAARLSHFFETTGPSIATESGCSSGIVAVHMACKSLQKHESNMALACGVNLLLHPFTYETLPFVLSKNGRCKTFDSSADGFARAEACTVLILKRFSDAVKDGDNIWGLIRGSAVTQEGISKSLGTPTVHCESLAMKMALQDSNVRPQDVDYIETHGTGTAVGDPLEVAAIAKAYSTADRFEPIVLGSVKTNVGHTESASGITGIIKVLLSMKNEQIPPHLNLETLNPAINLEAIPAEIPLTLKPWPKQENRTRIAGVSSFGISGTDGHAIIQEAPSYTNPQIHYGMDRPKHIMKISAKSPESMEELLAKYEQIFTEKAAKQDDEQFANLAYSANTGRATFNHRAVIIAYNFKEAAKILKEKSFDQADIQGNGSKLCFLFTGQGSQYPKMAYNLYETSPIFRDHFDKCDQILGKQYGIDMRNVLWGKSNDAAELSRTLYSQTSIFVIEYCLLKLWESWGVKPDYVMGHSLGEFAAACAAGALTFEDALMLVAERSRLIDNLPRGKMLVIRADKATVDGHITKFKERNPKFWVDYAATNASDQTVVAGDSSNIEAFETYLKEKSLKTIILASTHAFHSRHMDPMLEAYEDAASNIKKLAIEDAAPKFISGMDGKLIQTDSINEKYWVRHTREKVSFIDACKAAEEEGCKLFLEVGPHPVLSALALMNIDGQSVTCLPSLRRGKDEWDTLLESLAKLHLSDWKGEIDWKGFDQYYKRSRVTLPFYPFNRKPTWVNRRYRPGVLHPLLGKLLPNASGRNVFEAELTLKTTNFVQDHVIGNTVVYPGSAFLEMCLAGGFSTVQGFNDDFTLPRRPIVLKGLQIQSPLALYESKLCVLQTIVELDEKDENAVGYSVGVHRHDDSDTNGGGHWAPHAFAKFLPVAPPLASHVTANIDISAIQSTWESSDNKEFYEKLPDVGLRFGPKFQSLEMGWRDTEKAALMRVKIPDDNSNYLIHPVVADAMIQAVMIWTSKEKLKKKLHVPVRVEEFIWLGTSNSTERYVYCANTEAGVGYALLTDGNGEPLAYMEAVEFAETSVKLVESMIRQQKTAMPNLWEEIYKNVPGPTQDAISFEEKACTSQSLTQEDIEEINAVSYNSDEENAFYKDIIHITKLYFIDGLIQLGWKPEIGKKFITKDLLTKLKIHEGHLGYCHFFLKQLAELGYLEMAAEPAFASVFSLKKSLPSSKEISEFIKAASTGYSSAKEQFRLIMEIGRNMKQLLTGEVPSLQVLFPTDPESKKPSAEKFYKELGELVDPPAAVLFTKKILTQLKQAVLRAKEANVEKPIIRILEAGAGTGGFSARYLQFIQKEGIRNFEYWYTDISAAFQTHADRIFAECPKNVVFKKYNIEIDPLEQGLYPEYFDLVVAAEVLHVAKDLKKTLKNIRTLVKPGGVMQIIETACQSPVITFVFGLLEGYWQFKDFDLRPDHTTLTVSKWKEAFESAGFCNVVGVPVYQNTHAFIYGFANKESQLQLASLRNVSKENHSWILFSDNTEMTNNIQRHLECLNRKVLTLPKPDKALDEQSIELLISNAIKRTTENQIHLEGVVYSWGLSSDPNERDQSLVALPFLSLCKAMPSIEGNKSPKIVFLTQGQFSVEESDAINPVPATLAGIAKSVVNELSFNILHMDLCPTKCPAAQMNEILANLWTSNEPAVVFRNGNRFCPKLAAGKVQDDCISIPNGCDRYQLILPKTRVISDLEFGYLEPFELSETEVEVKIKAMALNFRDVFTVLKPIKEFENFNQVGLDYAGTIVRIGSKITKFKVGDNVIGMVMDGDLSLPSHTKAHESLIVHLPPEMTFAEGVTLPAVFSTVIYCLINTAKIKKGETLLLHTATGGVGCVAIQLAKHIGVEIIATAGSKRKRNYLHNLGIKHVFNSRTTEFGKQILEVTNGKGVDVVLNSLTGEGFKEASLNALGKNGRFIEMSKLNIWTSKEVEAIRPDVFYEVVDLTTLKKDQYEALNESLREYLYQGFIRPTPYETFDGLNIRGALYYMQKAKHIGKIVCLMPEVKIENSKIVVQTMLFNDQSTYIITGGLGGIGFEVAKFMLSKGAKHIALVSRSKPKPEVEKIIESLNASGKHVEAFSVDIGDYEQCKSLFDHLNSPKSGFPKIRGVMHAAGVLSDALLLNQNWNTCNFTFNPKVKGTWNLHDLTKDLLLEHFVLFSSMAATLGSPGQANHAASNNFEDGLALYRRFNGLPATSINWGNWGEVGVATEIDFPGIRPISTRQGMLALETMLKTQKSHIAVLNVESFALMTQLFPNLKQYIADKRLLGETRTTVLINSDEFWQKVDAAQDRTQKLDVFKNFIKITVKNILKLESSEEVDDHAEFQVLGIDSLMMLEMKNSLQNILGSRLTITVEQLKDCTNTEMLANRLVDVLEGGDESDAKIPTIEELRDLVREESILPQHISIQEGINPAKNSVEIQTILLTGVTGVLGPYLLREFTNRSQITKIYCLIRKSGKIEPKDRLKKRLEVVGLANQVDLSKVECISGDITYDRLGLSKEVYEALAENVDSVVHCAVLADHTAKYWKAPEHKKRCVRSVNVKGTIRLLEFSVTKAIKHFYYASTLLSVPTVNEQGSMSEDWQDIGAFDVMTWNAGYPISKFISEQHIKQAVERGVPGKVFRFGMIGGDSTSGRHDYLQAHVVLRWLAYLKLQCMPDLPTPLHIFPVDYCAKFTAEVFFNPNASNDCYNVMHPQGGMDQMLIGIAEEMGIQIAPVSFSEFVAKLKQEDDNSPLAQYKKTYEDEEQSVLENFEGNPSIKALQKYVEDSNNFFTSYKMPKYIPNYNNYDSTETSMRRDLKYLQQIGVFEKFGIK